jgi:hypothetical protein
MHGPDSSPCRCRVQLLSLVGSELLAGWMSGGQRRGGLGSGVEGGGHEVLQEPVPQQLSLELLTPLLVPGGQLAHGLRWKALPLRLALCTLAAAGLLLRSRAATRRVLVDGLLAQRRRTAATQ